MNPSEMREKTDDELKQFIVDCTDDLMHFRLQEATGVVDNKCLARNTRKDIARAKTILNERARAAQAGASEAN